VRDVSRHIGILIDTKGPEVRTTGCDAPIEYKTGDVVKIFGRPEMDTTHDIINLSYPNFAADVYEGCHILFDDGALDMKVIGIYGPQVIAQVMNDGQLGSHKSVNVPGVHIALPPLTDKDRKNILLAIEQDIDFIAASFVRNADAVREIRDLLREHDASDVHIIAKIENAEGIRNIDSIIRAADGVMVARGDMGVEIPSWEVPHVQRKIIDKCNAAYKPVIVATQMLDSMMRNPRPTRAEVTDVSNAIVQSADAIMLSGETAAGRYPVEAVQMMAQIAEYTEAQISYEVPDFKRLRGKANVSSAVGIGAVRTAANLNAKAMVIPTMSGLSARLVANFRPEMPIYAVTPSERAARQLQLDWGVLPLQGYREDSTENIISHAMYVVTRDKYIKSGDLVVVTAGDPATNEVRGEGNMTNVMFVIEAK
jgi:pyruvate kinase